MTFSEKHHECQQCRVQLHTSLILIILGLFLILLCCRLRSVCDLDAVHSPWNSYLWTSVTYSIIIQPRWPRQKCWSHHFCGLDSARYCDCNSGRYCNKPATLSASISMRSQIKTPYSKYSNIDDYKLWSLQWSIAKLLGFFLHKLMLCFQHCWYLGHNNEIHSWQHPEEKNSICSGESLKHTLRVPFSSPISI